MFLSIPHKRNRTELIVFYATPRICNQSINGPTSSHIAVASFLKHPGIAIRIGEVGEAGIVAARRVKPRCETSVPRSNIEQAAPCCLEVYDYEIDAAK